VKRNRDIHTKFVCWTVWLDTRWKYVVLNAGDHDGLWCVHGNSRTRTQWIPLHVVQRLCFRVGKYTFGWSWLLPRKRGTSFRIRSHCGSIRQVFQKTWKFIQWLWSVFIRRSILDNVVFIFLYINMKAKSKFLTLNERDLIKGFVMAILGAWLTALYNLLQTWSTLGKEQLIACAVAWVSAGLGYLIKNLFENSEWSVWP
jgi:hypothetical protein